MKKPVIGIVTRTFEEGRDYILGVSEEYRLAVLQAGGIPIFISPTNRTCYQRELEVETSKFKESEIQDFYQILSLCDGFLSPGGETIYDFDRLVCQYAYEKNIPYLGICLGMQMLGGMDYFLKGQVVDPTILNESTIQHYVPDTLFVHRNRIFPSKLRDILGVEEIYVNSRHHSHIAEKDFFHVSSRSSDGLIEGIEIPSKKFMLDVQWHPESMIQEEPRMIHLFQAFVEACRKK